jgi:cytochrome c oxidase assembly protein subunit 15
MNNPKNKPVIIWLLTGCVLLFIMVMVGGITRLTNSGLSMTDWHLVADTFPPLSEEGWQEAFDDYKNYPEYQKINQHKPGGFLIDDYKFIYFWEWFHRFIGRVIGLVFILPFLYFLIKKQLSTSTIKKCLVLLFMGGFQGFLGWFMVKSGLIDQPDVSHYRLALHLTFAFLTFAYTLWVALDLIYENSTKNILPKLQGLTKMTFAVLIVQIIWGGFVAGLDAGQVHNHWPMMSDGQFFHESIAIEKESLFSAFVEGKSGVQFVHRSLAYLVVILITILFFKSKSMSLLASQRNGMIFLVAMVLVQFTLGVLTLLLNVPLWLGLAHQLGAFFLLSGVVYVMHRVHK